MKKKTSNTKKAGTASARSKNEDEETPVSADSHVDFDLPKHGEDDEESKNKEQAKQ